MKALKPDKNKEAIKSIEGVFPKDMTTNGIKNKLCEIKKWEEETKPKDLKHKTKN